MLREAMQEKDVIIKDMLDYIHIYRMIKMKNKKL